MRKTLFGAVLVIVVLLFCGGLMAQVITVPEGTPIKLKLLETLKCENSHEGDSVGFEVMDDVTIDGVTVIRHGALAYGRIADGTTWARRLGRGGKVALDLKYVTDVTGRQIPIAEGRYTQARGLGSEITVAMVYVPNPLWLLALGKRTNFPKEKMVIVVTRANADVNLTKLALNTPAQMPVKTDMPLKPFTPQLQRASYSSSYTVSFDSPKLIASR